MAGEPAELTTQGQRTAYVASVLPAFDQGGDLDFSASDFEPVRNAVSGIAYAWDRHAVAVTVVDRDPVE